jgi:hypothetical protein
MEDDRPQPEHNNPASRQLEKCDAVSSVNVPETEQLRKRINATGGSGKRSRMHRKACSRDDSEARALLGERLRLAQVRRR